MDKLAELERELATANARIAELEQGEVQARQSQVQLQQMIQSYQNLFEYAGDSIFIIDPRTLKIIEANTNAARRLGYTMDELLNLRLDTLEVANDEEMPSSDLSWESATTGTQVYECRYRRKDGGLVPVEVSSRIVRIGGQEVLQNFVRDISMRKEIEAERERLILDLDAFAHTVAHDLKNPLAVFLGYSELLAEDINDMDPADVQLYLVRMKEMSLKMRNIIDELLLLASVRRIKDVSIERIQMGEIVQEALARLGTLIDKHEPQIHLPKAWPVALGHAAWIEEVWANYISNAIKYGGKPPILELGGEVQNDAMARFWVRDNGAGIPAEKLKLLFSQFTRLDQTRAEGYGLGLSIVQRILEKMGGEVGVESREGEGSIFSFTLPLAR